MRRPPSGSMLALLAALLAFSSDVRACSQCACGMPFPADPLGGPAPQRLRYGLEDRYLSKENALDEAPGTEQEDEHHLGGYALARLSSRVMLLGRLPYVFKQITERPDGEASTVSKSQGLGDAEVTALFKLAELGPATGNRGLVSVVAGARMPTGANNLEDGTGVRRDEHLQPGSGAWSGLAGMDLTVPTSGSRLDFNLSYRVNGENSEGYRYGNAFLYNAGIAKRAGAAWELALQANGRVAEKDDVGSGTQDENTGGHVLYVSPLARWFVGSGLQIEASAQFPVASELNGIQQEHPTARVAFSLAR